MFNKWKESRETELVLLWCIAARKKKSTLQFSHVSQSKEKSKAFFEYLQNKLTQINSDCKREELEKELEEVLKETLEGLEKLDIFLHAVEKLAVTSLQVFTKYQIVHLPKEINCDDILEVIKYARHICSLLLLFKRDAKTFFLPRLQNVEVLVYQLEKHNETTDEICKD